MAIAVPATGFDAGFKRAGRGAASPPARSVPAGGNANAEDQSTNAVAATLRKRAFFFMSFFLVKLSTVHATSTCSSDPFAAL
jgi:hypothetical protein